MLCRLIRFALLVQMLFGLGMGLALGNALQAGPGITLVLVVLLWVLLPLLGVAGMTSTSFVRSRGAGPHRAWWSALRGEFRAVLRIVFLQELWGPARPAANAAASTPGQTPVLLVHGYVSNHRVWDALARKLRRSGHTVHTVDLEPLFTSIDDYVPRLEAAVTRLCHCTGAETVALVGHSMGGLAIRAWMRRHGTARVHKVLTLGTPHVGTLADPFPLTPNSQQMVYRSAWLETLAAHETPATRQRMHLAYSPQDNVVYPQQAQTLPGASLTAFEERGHLQLVQDPEVMRWVLALLAKP